MSIRDDWPEFTAMLPLSSLKFWLADIKITLANSS